LSAPIAAGVAALVIEAAGTIAPADVKMILKSTAKDLGFDAHSQGAGRVDPVAAVAMANAGGSLYKFNSDMSGSVRAAYLYNTGLFDYWFSGAAYSTEEGGLGGEINGTWADWFYNAGYPYTNDSDFHAGALFPGDSVTGYMGVGSAVPTMTAVYDNLTHKYSGSFWTNSTIAHQFFASYWNETFVAVKIEDLIGSTAYADLLANGEAFDLSVNIDAEAYNNTSALTFLNPNIIAWDDVNSNGIVEMSANEEYVLDTVGEYNVVAYFGGSYFSWYHPVGKPATAFANGEGTLIMRIYNNNGTHYQNLNGIKFNYVVNQYERNTWNWVSVGAGTTTGEWAVTIDVPATAMPGSYTGYLKLNNGQLCPLSFSVVGTVTERNYAPKSSTNPANYFGYVQSSWYGTKDEGDSSFTNYVFNSVSEWRNYPIAIGDDARSLWVRVTCEDADADLMVQLTDDWGWVFGEYSGVGTVMFLMDMTSVPGYAYFPGYLFKYDPIIYLMVQLGGTYLCEPEFTIEIAFAEETVSQCAPSLTATSDGGSNLMNLEGPHANITATFGSSLLFPEIAVNLVELWIPGVTTEESTDQLTGSFTAEPWTIEEEYDWVAGDIVYMILSWTGASSDMDLYLYDPNGDQMDFDVSYYGAGYEYAGMATGNNPEHNSFHALLTGTYTIEISDYDKAGCAWTLSIRTVRASPLYGAAGAKTITVDTMSVAGKAVADGANMLQLFGYTNTESVTYYVEVPFSANNWLPPSINIVDDAIAVTAAMGRATPVTFNWTSVDPNANEPVMIDLSDAVVYHIYWRIVTRTDISAYLPGGVITFVSTDWELVADLSTKEFSWTISDTKKYPDGLYEFMVIADDGGDDPLFYDTVLVSLGTGNPPVKPTTTVTTTLPGTTVTVTVTVTETVTVTPTHGLEFIVLLAGIGGAFLVKKRRK
jgi:hypothetical protein